MIAIKIASSLKTKDVTSRKGPLTIRYQEADLIQPDRRPRYLEVTPPANQEYEVDEFYSVAPHSVRTNDYDKLELSRYVDLIPLADAVKFATSCLTDTSK